MNWQPIETAPKDGTAILVYWPATERERFGLHGESLGFERSEEGMTVAEWMDWANDCSLWSAVAGADGGYLTYVPGDPTHWMPLPPKPSKDEEPEHLGFYDVEDADLDWEEDERSR